MEQYWDSIRARVCRKCIDGDGKGNCRLPAGEKCSIREFLPELVSVVNNLRLDSYDAYIHALRKGVCTQCEHQEADGTCQRRKALECALDRYYPIVIEVLEGLKEEVGLRT